MQLCYVNAQQLRQLEDCSSFWLTWQQQVSISKCRAVFPVFLSALGTLCLVFFLCCPLFGVTGSRPYDMYGS
jgi:hypothetical protein